MNHPLRFVACLLMASGNPCHVTSQPSTAQTLCCPVQEHRNGVHVHCSDRVLESFLWSNDAGITLDAAREEICLVNTNSFPPAGSKFADYSNGKVLWLDLSRNTLESLPEFSHRSLAALFHLNLSRNVMQHAHDTALSSLQRLETLDLSFNRLSVMPNLSTPGLSGLVFLDLSFNSIEVIPPHALRGLSRLETLNISHNQLVSLTSDSLADLKSLVILHLGSNRLESLPVTVFDEMSQLLILDMNGNFLTTVHKLLFQSLLQLKTLNLSKNFLTQIPEEALRSLSRLEFLDLSNNKLRNISGGIFQSLTKLVRLELAENELRAICMKTFKGLKSLKHLDLSSNRLATIRKASFNTLERLLWLSLRSNVLKRLHEHLLAGLKWLDHLDLSHNQLQLDLQTFPPDLFSPVPNLHHLHLDHNDDRTEGRYPRQVFASLGQLRHLSIDTFATVSFHGDFAALAELKTLDLPDCKIETLTPDSFLGLKDSSLVRLSLEGCPLRQIEGCAFCGFKRLEQLSVTNRPPRSISAATSALSTKGGFIGPENTFLRKLDLSNLTLHPDMVQSLADHTLKNLDQLQVLDLSSNNLCGVNLTLPTSVRQLLLSGNRFESVPVDLSYLRHLVVVDMSDNNISSLSSSQRESLDRLAEEQNFTIRFRGNELKCPHDSCENADFLNWMCSTRVSMEDGPTKGCNFPCTTAEGKTTSVGEAVKICNSRRPSVCVYTGLTSVVCILVASVFALVKCRSPKKTLVERKEDRASNGLHTRETLATGSTDVETDTDSEDKEDDRPQGDLEQSYAGELDFNTRPLDVDPSTQCSRFSNPVDPDFTAVYSHHHDTERKQYYGADELASDRETSEHLQPAGRSSDDPHSFLLRFDREHQLPRRAREVPWREDTSRTGPALSYERSVHVRAASPAWAVVDYNREVVQSYVNDPSPPPSYSQVFGAENQARELQSQACELHY